MWVPNMYVYVCSKKELSTLALGKNKIMCSNSNNIVIVTIVIYEKIC